MRGAAGKLPAGPRLEGALGATGKGAPASAAHHHFGAALAKPARFRQCACHRVSPFSDGAEQSCRISPPGDPPYHSRAWRLSSAKSLVGSLYRLRASVADRGSGIINPENPSDAE